MRILLHPLILPLHLIEESQEVTDGSQAAHLGGEYLLFHNVKHLYDKREMTRLQEDTHFFMYVSGK